MLRVLDYFENLEDEEVIFLRTLMEDMDAKTASRFAEIYKKRRRKPALVMGLTLLGFLGVAGIQRFYVGKVGTGLLYLLTLGFLFLGTLYDLATYRKAAHDCNKLAAQRVDLEVRGI